jgi:serine/threonine protein kinase
MSGDYFRGFNSYYKDSEETIEQNRRRRSRDYQKLKFIGNGAYSRVFADEEETAYKQIIVDEKNIQQWVVREIAILRKLEHPNCTTVKGLKKDVTQHSIQYYITMKQAVGPLSLYRKQLSTEKHFRKQCFYQILKAVAYLHANNIWHRDIKPDNILTFQDGTLQLADYGISIYGAVQHRHGQSQYNYQRHTGYVVTRWYRAPEILIGEPYNESVDVWSVGVMLAEALGYLLDGKSSKSQFYRILHMIGCPTKDNWSNFIASRQYERKGNSMKKYTNQFEHIFKHIDVDERDLLRQLLAYPDHRISAAKALDHEYFKDVKVNIETLITSKYPNGINSPINTDSPLLKIEDAILKERVIVFKWLVEVNHSMKHDISVLFHTYLIFDLYLTKTPLVYVGSILQAIAIASYMICEKLISGEHPIQMYTDLCINNIHCTIAQIYGMQLNILDTLKWDIIFDTCYVMYCKKYIIPPRSSIVKIMIKLICDRKEPYTHTNIFNDFLIKTFDPREYIRKPLTPLITKPLTPPFKKPLTAPFKTELMLSNNTIPRSSAIGINLHPNHNRLRRNSDIILPNSLH